MRLSLLDGSEELGLLFGTVSFHPPSPIRPGALALRQDLRRARVTPPRKRLVRSRDDRIGSHPPPHHSVGNRGHRTRSHLWVVILALVLVLVLALVLSALLARPFGRRFLNCALLASRLGRRFLNCDPLASWFWVDVFFPLFLLESCAQSLGFVLPIPPTAPQVRYQQLASNRGRCARRVLLESDGVVDAHGSLA